MKKISITLASLRENDHSTISTTTIKKKIANVGGVVETETFV